ncbi:MAG: carbohydrate ABC transporter permease [Eubacteriales bacterium]|nr:carbohydrate ABC transporter permease [Eubacteriales bacterium]
MYRILVYLVLGIVSFSCLFFFYILIINATRAHSEIQTGFSFLPGKFLTQNWDNMMSNDQLPMWNGILNSLFVSSCVAALTTYFSALTAYAIHAYQFKLKDTIFKFILLVMAIPTQVATLGFIRMISGWGWMDTFYPLILPSIAAPIVFFFMKQYMESTLPLEIVEAARIDGGGEFGIFNRIVLPILKPAVAVQAIFSFVSSWNNYFLPALVIRSADKKTLPILIAQLRSADWLKFDMGQVYMAIALAIMPIIIVYLLLSKFIVRGITLGSVKG